MWLIDVDITHFSQGLTHGDAQEVGFVDRCGVADSQRYIEISESIFRAKAPAARGFGDQDF